MTIPYFGDTVTNITTYGAATFGRGWCCPVCGGGNAPTATRCPCVALPTAPPPAPYVRPPSSPLSPWVPSSWLPDSGPYWVASCRADSAEAPRAAD